MAADGQGRAARSAAGRGSDPTAVSALDVVRFLTELALLAGAAVAGAEVGWSVAILAPVGVAVVWGLAVAPKAARRLPDPARLVVELVLFAAVGAGLVAARHVAAGVVLAAVCAVVAVLVRTAGAERERGPAA